MPDKINYLGSQWNKWDLHVHTPCSLNQKYGGDNEKAWEQFINEIESLPVEFKVIGINDYLFLEGYKKVLEYKKKGRLNNIERFFPVIEFRIDKFGGTDGNLKKINFHVIFSDELDADVIDAHFLKALPNKFILSSDGEDSKGNWNALLTMGSLEDLGSRIIESIPEEERSKFGSPLVEGFNNISFDIKDIRHTLNSDYLKDKYLTAVGKTEWAAIKWNSQSIADKKTIINSVDFVFIASDSPAHAVNTQKSLHDSNVNSRLLDCSDAHYFTDSDDKDRLGNCFTWIKADCCFEGLRQASLEPLSRIIFSENKPLSPIHKIGKVKFKFPADTSLQGEKFCFRGEHEVCFSPYFTCLTGGRGTGKSTVLNLIHERLNPGENEFFIDKNLTSNTKITFDESVLFEEEEKEYYLEFLSQNKIEEFALDNNKFTSSIFSRLKMLDNLSVLEENELEMMKHLKSLENIQELLVEIRDVTKDRDDAKKELETNNRIISSLEDDEYKIISSNLKTKTEHQEKIRASQRRLTGVVDVIKTLPLNLDNITEIDNDYDKEFSELITFLKDKLSILENPDNFKNILDVELQLSSDIKKYREELNKYLSGKGISDENVKDLSLANEKVAQLTEYISDMGTRIDYIEEQIKKIDLDRDLLSGFKIIIDEQLSPLNERLSVQNEYVSSIELCFEFDFISANNDLLLGIQDMLDGEDDERAPRWDYIHKSLSKVDFFDGFSKEKLLETLDTKEQTKTSKKIYKYFEDDINYKILYAKVQQARNNFNKYKKINVHYGGRELDKLSFGQRCTAAIVILVLLGNTPIVIDEPEAHLDSQLIANYLVDLIKKQKEHRQIIFATHNANFVINGDAELINTLNVDDDGITEIVPCSIEKIECRPNLLALEGGKEAFEKREKRYSL